MYGKWNKDDALIEKVKLLVPLSFSYGNILKELGMKPTGSHYIGLKRLCQRLNLDVGHFTGRGHLRGKTHNWGVRRELEDILVEKSTYSNSTTLKSRLVKTGLLAPFCAACGLGICWKGKALVLQLDHVNGIKDDNRLKNLRLLCPNCHSQTETYCGKNIEK